MISLAHFFVYIVIDSGIVSSRYCLMLYDSLPSFSFKWSFLSWVQFGYKCFVILFLFLFFIPFFIPFSLLLV